MDSMKNSDSEKESNRDDANCDPYGYVEEAHKIIDDVIHKASSSVQLYIDDINDGSNKYTENVYDELENIKNVTLTEEESTMKEHSTMSTDEFKWLSAEDFSVDKGKEKIEEFLKTWERDGSWLHCIDYLGSEEEECNCTYRYRVKWSMPTRRKPIPKATASVYFTIAVNKFKPKNFPVDVFYIFETNRMVHRPGQTRFRQKWLKDIIESKIGMMEQINF